MQTRGQKKPLCLKVFVRLRCCPSKCSFQDFFTKKTYRNRSSSTQLTSLKIWSDQHPMFAWWDRCQNQDAAMTKLIPGRMKREREREKLLIFPWGMMLLMTATISARATILLVLLLLLLLLLLLPSPWFDSSAPAVVTTAAQLFWMITDNAASLSEAAAAAAAASSSIMGGRRRKKDGSMFGGEGMLIDSVPK